MAILVLSISFVILSLDGPAVGPADGAVLRVGTGQTYTSINQALGAANLGDTIQVDDGTYEESLVVDKVVEIIGTSVDGTIVKGNGTGSVIRIEESGVNLSTLSVMGAHTSEACGGILIVGANNCSITNVRGHEAGGCGLIIDRGCQDIVVTGSYFGKNTCHGIHVRDSSEGHTISDNNCSDNGENGVFLENFCNLTTVSNNICKWNGYVGIYVYVDCYNNSVFDNNCSFNGNTGVALGGGYNVGTSNECHQNGVSGLGVGGEGVVARRNHAYSNGKYGISVGGSGSLVEENTCFDHQSGEQMKVYTGINVYRGGANTTILRNTVRKSDRGILVGYSTGVVVKDNLCTDSIGTAIYISWDCTNILLEGNTLTRQSIGIFVSSDNCTLNANTISECEDRGIYIDGHWSQPLTDNTVITNNTVHHCTEEGINVESKNTTVANNTVYSCGSTGIWIHREDNLVEHNHVYDNADTGIRAAKEQSTSYKKPVNAILRYNRAHDNTGSGIGIDTSATLLVVGNICDDNGYDGIAVGSYGGIIRDNVCTNDYIKVYTYGYIVIVDNTCSGISVNIIIDGAAVSVTENIISGNGVGLRVYGDSPTSLFENNTMSGNEYGVYLGSGCSNITVSNNTLVGNKYGVFITACRNVSIVNNVIKDSSDYSILVTRSSAPGAPTCRDNIILGNLILGGGRYSVRLNYCTNITLTGNRIKGSPLGLYLLQTVDCLIYDNWFSNVENWDGERNTGTVWNVTKRSGTNICGFDYQGGNYWSDYQGHDTDGDWIGDTQVPHGPGDHLPLVRETVPPSIVDKTTGNPTTSDRFSIWVEATDNRRIWTVWLNYSLDSGPWVNVTMGLVVGDTYSHSIPVPPDQTGDLNYFVTAFDLSDNGIDTDVRSLNVVDDDPPEISGCSVPEVATTGDPVWFEVNATDNVGITDAWLEYWWGTSDHVNESMEAYIFPRWALKLDAPHTLESLFCVFHVTDLWRNSNESGPFEVRLRDNDPPLIWSYLSPDQTYTGDVFTISVVIEENVALANVQVEIQFGSGPFTNLTMDMTEIDTWSADVSIPIDSMEPLRYWVLAVDSSNLSTQGTQRTVQVLDGAPPELVSDMTASETVAGRPIVFKVDVVDNIAVAEVWVVYRHGDDVAYNASCDRGSGDLWTATVEVPWSGGFVTYDFHARDEVGNTVDGVTRSIAIIDQGPPWFWSDESDGQAFTGDPFRMAIEVWDSNGLDVVCVVYQFGISASSNRTMDHASGDLWEFSIMVLPDATGPLRYSFFAMDGSGNTNTTSSRRVDVLDNDAPVVDPGSHPSDVEIGTEFLFQAHVGDNIEVARVWVLVTVPFEGERNLTMARGEGDLWTVSDSYDSFVKCTCVLWARDVSGNQASVAGPTFTIVDLSPPVVGYVSVDPNPQKAGYAVTFIVEITDASLTSGAFLVVENPESKVSNRSMEISGENTWELTVTFTMVGDHQLIVVAKDSHGHWGESEIQVLRIVRGDGGDGEGSDDDGGLGPIVLYILLLVICTVVVVTIAILVARRNRARPS